MTATETQIKVFLQAVISEAGRQERALVQRTRDLLNRGHRLSVVHMENVIEVNAAVTVATWIERELKVDRPALETLLKCRASALDVLSSMEAHTSLVGQAQIAANATACARFLKKTGSLL